MIDYYTFGDAILAKYNDNAYILNYSDETYQDLSHIKNMNVSFLLDLEKYTFPESEAKIIKKINLDGTIVNDYNSFVKKNIPENTKRKFFLKRLGFLPGGEKINVRSEWHGNELIIFTNREVLKLKTFCMISNVILGEYAGFSIEVTLFDKVTLTYYKEYDVIHYCAIATKDKKSYLKDVYFEQL